MLADQTVWVQRIYTVNKNEAVTTRHLNPTLEPESGLIIYVITKFKDQQPNISLNNPFDSHVSPLGSA